MAQEYKVQFEEEQRMNNELNDQIKNLLLKIQTLKRQIEESVSRDFFPCSFYSELSNKHNLQDTNLNKFNV